MTHSAPHAVSEASTILVEYREFPGRSAASTVDAASGAALVLKRGDFVVAVGGCGSGKSRLVETLAGFAPPPAGDIRIFGRQLSEIRGDDWVEIRRRMGVVFEMGSRLFPQMSVLENVILPLRYHLDISADEAHERVSRMLRALGLDKVLHGLPGRLSREWRPRIALARALALEPELLLLDNPLAGLDPEHSTWWTTLLAEMSKGGGPIGPKPMTLLVTADDCSRWQSAGATFVHLQRHDPQPFTSGRK